MDSNSKDPTYTITLELDLSDVQPCISGPKRPHDKVSLNKQAAEWKEVLTNKVGFKGFGLEPSKVSEKTNFKYKGEKYNLENGSIVVAAITSCTNTSNPDSLVAAGLVAKRANEAGLSVKPYIKTILAPGSGVVSKYFSESDL